MPRAREVQAIDLVSTGIPVPIRVAFLVAVCQVDANAVIETDERNRTTATFANSCFVILSPDGYYDDLVKGSCRPVVVAYGTNGTDNEELWYIVPDGTTATTTIEARGGIPDGVPLDNVPIADLARVLTERFRSMQALRAP